MKVRRLAKVTGIIGSFLLAMGNVVRFHTRGMIAQIASLAEKWGWEGSLRLEQHVVV